VELHHSTASGPLRGRTLSHAAHMERVVLKDGRTSLIFSNPVRVGTLPAENLSVTIAGRELRANRQVYEGRTGGFEPLAAFLASLANDWRGWPDSATTSPSRVIFASRRHMTATSTRATRPCDLSAERLADDPAANEQVHMVVDPTTAE
jgi:hypothetical protein